MQSIKFVFEGTEIKLNTHDSPDHLYNVLKHYGTFYELDLLTAARKLYDDNSVIIDVGANIGNHSIFFSKVLGANVIAFEPFEKNREIFIQNINDNNCENKINLVPYALGEQSGYGVSEVTAANNPGNITIHTASKGDVEIVRLDDFLKREIIIGIIKIDVEGFELAVIKGAIETLRVHKPHLFIEAGTLQELESLKELILPVGYNLGARYCATPTYHFKPNTV